MNARTRLRRAGFANPSEHDHSPSTRAHAVYSHTVLVNLGPAADATFFTKLRQFESAVRTSCAGVMEYRFATNEATSKKGFDHVLFSTFESRAAFVAYDRSALHGEIKDFLRPYVEDLVVADGDLPPIDAAR